MYRYEYNLNHVHLEHISVFWRVNRYLLGFFVLSFVIHLASLAWLANTTTPILSDAPDDVRPLSIKLDYPQPAQMKALQEKNDAKQIDKVDRSLPEKGSPLIKQTDEKRSHAPDDLTARTTEETLLQQIYNSIPAILKQIDEMESYENQAKIFEPGFQKKLEDSRREVERQQQARRLTKTQPIVEVLGKYEDHIGLRINNTCWRVPVDDHSERFDTRVWMMELSCQKQQMKLFGDLK